MRGYIKKISVYFFTVILIFSSVVYGIKKQAPAVKNSVMSAQLQRLTTVMEMIQKYYYAPVTVKALFDGAISGMLNSLDSHSAYLAPDALKNLEIHTLGKFGGIGVEVFPDRGAMKVISPIDDTPAYRAGIKAGDYIIKIGDKLVRDLDVQDTVDMMRGPQGSKVTLTIIRKGESKPLVITLRREIIKSKTVKERMLEPGYGYIRLSFFQEPTEQDMVKAIQKLQKSFQGELKGVILDLRNNPGGLLESAVQVADDFLNVNKLKGNELIVYTKGRNEEVQMVAKASEGELLANIPIVVLINEGSASAAEIVAGALKDHRRAIIVGTRSFGKGSVQVLLPIPKASAIKLTTALYYTPLGNSIQAKGIEPNITVQEIKIPRDQEALSLPRIDESSLVDHIQGVDEKRSKQNNTLELPRPNKVESTLIYDDYQLYEALQILKSKAVDTSS